MGSALMGSLQFLCFLTGTFWVRICQNLSKLHTFFPNLSKSITSAATPLVSTPFVRSQKVHYVRNVTDIDDKIIRKAGELGETAEGLARRMEEEIGSKQGP